MESGQLRKLNLCYAGIQSLYWAGFAAIWAFLSVLLLYRGFSNSQIGTVSALALLMPLAVQPVLASLADRNRRFTSRRLAMALTGLLPLCAVGLWCSAGSMAVTAAMPSTVAPHRRRSKGFSRLATNVSAAKIPQVT